ncbi:protein FAM210B, mitochondrial [Rhinatrema bivittatum]|uniref:protein FAM210B, mitochondrial n=1 Tax=Rhinatrema bivittatum TaxID=194408 RepID=UPI00112D80EF|nr:protein FAM210B, mitochondrial [Rhinatrema bivittatum]
MHGRLWLGGCCWPKRCAAALPGLAWRRGAGRSAAGPGARHPRPQTAVRASCSPAAAARKEPSGDTGKGATDPNRGEEKKPNKSQQLKQVFKEYGAVGVSFHVGISLMSLGAFYLIVSSGVDIAAVLLKIGFSEAVVQSKVAAGTSTFVLAYAIHKLFAPLRISITLVSVPFIVRYFRKIGLFKPSAPNP